MHSLEQFEKFVDEICESNSRNYKLGVLDRYKDNSAVLFYLQFVFDPYITTGMSAKKLAKQVFQTDAKFTSSVDLLHWIAFENSTGKDEVIAQVQAFERQMSDKQKELFNRVISKNLPIGIETMTINKVVPKLIRTFDVMLANKYFDKPELVEGHSFVLTTKIDGGRIIALKKDGEVKFYTRAGQLYEGLVDLENEMMDMPDNICLDGEITLLDAHGLESKEQYRQTMKITRKLGEKHGIKMKVFDCMTADQFLNRDCPTPYVNRRQHLADLFANHKLKFFELLPILYIGRDENQIITELEKQTSQGEEGVMINFADAPYQFGRGNALLKVKKMQDVDLTVVALEEGNNSNANSLGAFIVDYKGYKVRVGSGISKELRERVWANKEDYIGITISVQYFEETKNQDGGLSLRFPVFIDFRYDK